MRTIGADAVDIPIASEVAVVCYMGMQVLGISLITNTATVTETVEVNHSEVLSTADAEHERFVALMLGVLRGI